MNSIESKIAMTATDAKTASYKPKNNNQRMTTMKLITSMNYWLVAFVMASAVALTACSKKTTTKMTDAVEDTGDAAKDATGEAIEDTGDAIEDTGEAIEDTGDAIEDTGDAIEDTGEAIEN